MIIKNNNCIVDAINTGSELELYFNTKKYLQNAGVWTDEYTHILVRYVKMQSQYAELVKQKSTHYLIDKLAGHLSRLEEDLCLTPKSMLAYKKDRILMQAKFIDL